MSPLAMGRHFLANIVYHERPTVGHNQEMVCRDMNKRIVPEKSILGITINESLDISRNVIGGYE
jgi:hypothetical protein